jgi:hypothetical protein
VAGGLGLKQTEMSEKEGLQEIFTNRFAHYGFYSNFELLLSN